MTYRSPPEFDPKGLAPNDPGAKLDGGKVRLGLVVRGFARALMGVGKVGTYGATKYTDDGWLHVPDGERRYLDAMLRHLIADLAGEALDGESGLPHLDHALWNLAAVCELRKRREK